MSSPFFNFFHFSLLGFLTSYISNYKPFSWNCIVYRLHKEFARPLCNLSNFRSTLSRKNQLCTCTKTADSGRGKFVQNVEKNRLTFEGEYDTIYRALRPWARGHYTILPQICQPPNFLQNAQKPAEAEVKLRRVAQKEEVY